MFESVRAAASFLTRVPMGEVGEIRPADFARASMVFPAVGTVMGLIQVMKHLEDIKEVGHGIAVAFVATLYGVGVANLFFLPAASKLRT